MNESPPELQEELQAQVQNTRRNAKRNYFAAYINAVLSVAASIAATVLVAADGPKSLIATLAAIPAALTAIGTIFRFEQKSAWHWKKNKRLSGLLRALRYEKADPVDVSKAFSKTEEEMDQEWIAFGALGKADDSSG